MYVCVCVWYVGVDTPKGNYTHTLHVVACNSMNVRKKLLKFIVLCLTREKGVKMEEGGGGRSEGNKERRERREGEERKGRREGEERGGGERERREGGEREER